MLKSIYQITEVSQLKFRHVVLDLALLFITGFLWLIGFFYILQVTTSEHIQHPIVIGLLGITVGGTIIWRTQIMYFLHKIRQLIIKQQAFSQSAITLVKKVRRNIGIISLCFIFMLPFFFTAAQADDAPGLVLLGFAVVCTPFAIYILSQIIEDLFVSAFNLQKDHDLTV